MTGAQTLPPVRGRWDRDVPLAPRTWLRAGGPAEALFEPADAGDLEAFLAARPAGLPVTPIGVASNLLVRDGGIEGVVVRLRGPLAAISVEGPCLRVGAGATDRSIAIHAMQAGLSGLEFFIGIPGTLGGAVRMNAGAFGGETAEVVEQVIALDAHGRRHVLRPAELGFAYRHSTLPADWIVIEAVLKAVPGDPAAIRARMAAIKAEREASQPLRVATGGSTFKNPAGERKAWQLIDAAGCRGLRHGRAMVSEKHCNFLINTGGARAAEIEALGELVRARVLAAERRRARVGDPSHRPPGPSPGGGGMRHVAVLMGGWSAEREVSLVSGEAAAAALRQRGYQVSALDVGRDLAARLAELRPDVVFNALHGRGGEDGTVQGLLDIMGIPYSHSGLLASALAMNKAMAKRLFESAGLRCPESRLTTVEALRSGEPPLPVPYVVKPNQEGSSVGVRIVRDPGEPAIDRNDWPYGSEVLVERYIPGRELTVGVLGDRPLAVTEIVHAHGFFDYHAKYTANEAQHLIPAPLPRELYERALDQALRAHRALGCRGVTRSDFRLDPDDPDGLYLLELNTQPGMTPISLVPEQAAHVGIGFADLVHQLVEEARCDA